MTMTRTLTILAFAILGTALPLAAQDGGDVDYVARIGDSGVRQMDEPADDMDAANDSRGCMQLEMLMDMDGDECGEMPKSEVATRYMAAHS